MALHHTLGYRWTVGLLVAGAVVLLAMIVVPPLLAGRDTSDEELRATQDSLVALRTQTADALQQMRSRDQILKEANRSLDSLLRQPPTVVYLRRPKSVTGGTESAAPRAGASLANDPAPGDTLEPYVQLPVYEALESRCQSLSTACDSAQAAKDTVIALQAAQIANQGSIIAQQAAGAKRARRLGLFDRIRFGAFGAVFGYAACRL